MLALEDKINNIRLPNLATYLLPLFESRTFIEAGAQNFHVNFSRCAVSYTGE